MSAPGIETAANSAIAQIQTLIVYLLIAIEKAATVMSEVAGTTIIMLGFLIYLTRLNRRLGRELVVGGIILWILAVFLFGYLETLT